MSGGIYLDMFVNKQGETWYFGPGGDGSRVGRFASILAEGAYVATDYIWLYGEKHALIDWRSDLPQGVAGKDRRFDKVRAEGRYTWEKALPGYMNTIRVVTDPQGLASDALAANSGNLIDWSAYGSWQHERKSHGTFFKDTADKLSDGFSLVAKGVSQGCFIFDLPVKPGELYAICGAVKGKGQISITWSSHGKLATDERNYAIRTGTPDGNGWAQGMMSVCVPSGTDKMVIHCGVSGQTQEEEARFSGVRVVKISR